MAGSLRRRCVSRTRVISEAIFSSASSHETRENSPLPLRPVRTIGIPHAVGAVHALGEPPDLRADVPARHVARVAAIHLDDAPVADADGEAAGVRAVEGAGGGDVEVVAGGSVTHGVSVPLLAAWLRLTW